MTQRANILITGGSGLLGGGVVDRLRHLGPVCLTRKTPVDGVPNVKVDLGDEYLGLDTTDYRRLVADTDVIIHSAALTGFRVKRDQAMAVNAGGTRNLLTLAERSGAKFVYVSSAFVARRHHAPANRNENDPSPWNYLESKQAAEDLVRAADTPAVVVRPSVVIGDSLTGAVSAHQGFHTMLEAICKGLLPIIPFPETSVVDFIPQDIAAQAIVDIALDPVAAGEYWLTGGPDALTVRTISQACVDIMRDEEGRDTHLPKFVTHEKVDRLILPAFAPTLPARLLIKFLSLVAMGRLFGPDRDLFPTSLQNRIGDTPPLNRQLLQDALAANIRHSWGTPKALQLQDGAA